MSEVPPTLYNTKQVSAWLGLPVKTLECDRGRNLIGLPYIKIGKSIRYRKEDIEAFMARHTFNAVDA